MGKEKIEKWWNADHYLAGEIVECIAKLLKYQHGYPSRFRAKGKPESKCVKEWDDILREIHDGFKWYYDHDGDFYISKRLDKRRMRKFQRAKMLLVKYYEELWD